jgi:hypothetical protein
MIQKFLNRRQQNERRTVLALRTSDKTNVAFRSAKGRAFAERKPTMVLSEPLKASDKNMFELGADARPSYA